MSRYWMLYRSTDSIIRMPAFVWQTLSSYTGFSATQAIAHGVKKNRRYIASNLQGGSECRIALVLQQVRACQI